MGKKFHTHDKDEAKESRLSECVFLYAIWDLCVNEWAIDRNE